MENKRAKLDRQLEVALGDLPKTKKQADEAATAFQAEETAALVDERAPSEKVRKKLSETTEKYESLKARVSALKRAIVEVSEQEAREREQREYEAREAFRRKSEPVVTKLHKALFASRNAFLEFLELMESESINLPDLAGFLFPVADPTNPIDDMQIRFARLSTLNGLSAWIREDAMHSRSGPQTYQEVK